MAPRNGARRLMKVMVIKALVPKPALTQPNKNLKIYPYLRRDLTITEVDHVWCTKITKIPMEKEHIFIERLWRS